MPNHCGATRGLPFLKEFSAEARELVEKAAGEQEKRRQKAHDARSRKAAELEEKAARQLRDLLGAKTQATLQQLKQRETLAFRELRQPPHGLKSSFAKANRERKSKADAFLREHKVDPGRVKAIGAELHKGLQGVLLPSDGKVTPGYYLPGNLDKWLKLSPLHKAALPWGQVLDPDPNDPHRWFLFRPPFFGFNFGFTPVHNDNFRVDREHILRPADGLVGIVATMDDGDAGDFDYASVDAFSQIAFGFVPPTTGVVEVLIDAQSTVGTHDLQTEDEWGWSNSTTGQSNFLMLNVLHPNVVEPSYAEMSSFQLQTDDDTTTHRENLIRGQHYFAKLFSAGPVPAGQSVVVVVGTRSFDLSGTNDVEIHSASHFEWFINSVEVRIAP
jgi:hypothetical protein